MHPAKGSPRIPKNLQYQVQSTSIHCFYQLQHIQHFLMHTLHVEANFTANGFFIIDRAIGFRVSDKECCESLMGNSDDFD
jgi:hypothetical protein